MEKASISVLGLGDNVIDRFVDRGVFYPGGNGINFAVFARQLSVRSSFLGVFGNDGPADHIQFSLHELGISTDHCVTKEGETGWCDVRVVDGDRVFGEWNEGGITVSDPFVFTEDDLEYAKGFNLIHMAVYGGVDSQLPQLANLGPIVSYDFSDEEEYRTDEFLASVCPSVDLASFSLSELTWEEAHSFAEKVVAAGAKYCLFTRGADGAGFYDGNQHYQVAAHPVEAIDSMGCGDSFITAFCIGMLEQDWTKDSFPGALAVEKALRAAAVFAAGQTQVEGAYGYAKEIAS